MADLFETSFARLIDTEQGFTNDPRDPGNWTGGKPGVGELKGTKFGISAATYPHLDIENLTIEKAKEIYRTDFWDAITGVSDAVRFQVFDASVNHGASNAIRMLQRAVGVADDGRWGRISSSAAEAMDNNDILIRFLAERLDFMTKCSGWDAYGKGWSRRIAKDLRFAAQDN